MEETCQIEPLRLYTSPEAATLLNFSEAEIVDWYRKAGLQDRLVAGSRRYWGYDLLRALGVLPLPHQLAEIRPHRGYSAQQAAYLLGGIELDAFQRWAVRKVPAVVIGDQVVYPGRKLLEALGLTHPPLDRIEPYGVYTRSEATQVLRIGKAGFAALIASGHLKPIMVGQRRQLFLGQYLLAALKGLGSSQDHHDEELANV